MGVLLDPFLHLVYINKDYEVLKLKSILVIVSSYLAYLSYLCIICVFLCTLF